VSTQLVLGLALVVGAPALKPDPKQNAIVGEWAYHEVLDGDGQRVPCEGKRIHFEADGEVVESENGSESRSWYAADPATDPAGIDWMAPGAAGSFDRAVGIWRVDGDTLRICLADTGMPDRPTTFEPGPGRVVVTLKRVKKKD
jgi:uncharacterized protein (TIGR03067 family)